MWGSSTSHSLHFLDPLSSHTRTSAHFIDGTDSACGMGCPCTSNLTDCVDDVARVSRYAHPTKLAQLTSMVAITGGQFAAFPGGVLITTAQGSVVGAVGVSGARADEDELCAVLGVHRGGLGLVTGTPPPSL